MKDNTVNCDLFVINNEENLKSSNKEFSLDDFEIQLSEQEEELLSELVKIQKMQKVDSDILSGLWKAVEQGTMDYINSFVDTSEIMDDMKNRSALHHREKETIEYAQTSADPEVNAQRHFRTLKEAYRDPYAKDAKRDTSTMSDKGKERLRSYEEEYKQRVKTVDEHLGSTKLDSENSRKSLAGLRSYKFGPTVSCYSLEEYKVMYEQQRPNCSIAVWIRNKNYAKLDAELIKQLGFADKASCEKWRTENKLTPHEGSEGIYLVPTDVHRAEHHAGKVSEIQKYLLGDITKEQAIEIEKRVKIETIKNECKARGTRAVKGAGIAAVKMLIQNLVRIVIAESYNEFKAKSEDSLYQRMGRVAHICTERAKRELRPILSSIMQGAAFSVGMEILTALNDFFFKTAKNILKIIRSMIGSIISALKIISSSEYSWEEKLFEASKIVSAGFIAAIGFSLDEIIEKLIITWIPPMTFAAPFIADVFSGLFASIMSAVVLASFDSYKGSIQISSMQLKESLLLMNLIQSSNARIMISSLRAGESIIETNMFFNNAVSHISDKRNGIVAQDMRVDEMAADINRLVPRVTNRIGNLQALLRKMEEEDD